MAGRSGELSKAKTKPGRPCYDLLPEERVDYFLVLDFEGVNNKYHGGPDIMEIIEFPVLKVNAQTLETESIFHSYVQPTIHTQLNPVCTEITGITQAMVIGQPKLPEVLKLLDDWMKAERLLEEGVTICFVTCGDWDLKTGLPTQCTYQKIDYPEYLRKWVNIKDIFMKLTGTKGFSMKTMLKDLHLELEGRHHSGIDDSKNIAKILKTLAGIDPTKLGQGFVQPKVLK